MTGTLRIAFGALSVAAILATPVAAQPFTPKMMASLPRYQDARLSPDGQYALYTVRTVDYDANTAHQALWLINTKTQVSRRLAISADGASSGRWAPDGTIYYLASDPKTKLTQVFRTDIQGEKATQVSFAPLSVEAFSMVPGGKKLILAFAEYPDCNGLECTVQRQAENAKSKATGHLYKRLFIRHWGTWEDGTFNHLYEMTLSTQGDAAKQASAYTPLMAGFDGNTPTKPWGGTEDYTVSPDGRTVIFSAKWYGHDAPWKTNFDLWQVSLDHPAKPVNLTEKNKAWDGTPVFSPDGSQLAYLAMKRPGFESDRFGIMVRDMKTGATREIDPKWDRSPSSIAWSQDGKTIYAVAEDVADTKLFAVDVATGSVRALTHEGSVTGFERVGDKILYMHDSLDSPNMIFEMAANGGKATQLTKAPEALQQVKWGQVSRFTFKGWNNETVHGIAIKPANYKNGKKYPVAFLIHGGPQGSFNDSWSYRWNPQIYTNAGYAVVMIDFHGSTGYGQAFTDSISQHWGDRPLEDLKKGWAAALAKYNYLDKDNAVALGASYGGFMINWIAGNWNSPWKALICHDGVFDSRGMGYSTEELWFDEWEHGQKTFWEDPKAYEKFNPVNYVQNWKVPMLVIHGGQDFRIPLAQGIGAFTVLQRRGIPSEMLYFPDENHWVLQPQNSVLWHHTVLSWMAKWTGNKAKPAK